MVYKSPGDHPLISDHGERGGDATKPLLVLLLLLLPEGSDPPPAWLAVCAGSLENESTRYEQKCPDRDGNIYISETFARKGKISMPITPWFCWRSHPWAGSIGLLHPQIHPAPSQSQTCSGPHPVWESQRFGAFLSCFYSVKIKICILDQPHTSSGRDPRGSCQ